MRGWLLASEIALREAASKVMDAGLPAFVKAAAARCTSLISDLHLGTPLLSNYSDSDVKCLHSSACLVTVVWKSADERVGAPR